MHIEVDRKAAAAAMKLVRFAGRQGGDHIYSCVQVQGQGPDLRLEATDLQMSVRVSVPAQVTGAGTAVLPAKAVSDVVGSLAGETIVWYDVGDHTVLTSGESRCQLLGRDPQDFPLFPEVVGTELQLSASQLGAVLDRVRYCMCPDVTRTHLNGALLEVDGDGGKLIAVATDGHRLAVAQEDIGDFHAPIRVVIPALAVQQICEILHVCTGEVILAVDEGHVSLYGTLREAAGTVRCVTAVSAVQFPPYEKVIPTGDPTTVGCVDPGLLGDAVRRVSVLAEAKGVGAVKLSYVSGALQLEATGSVGNSTDRVELDVNNADMPPIALNAKYLADALAVTSQPVVELDVRGTMDPFVIREEGYLAVIMPMRF